MSISTAVLAGEDECRGGAAVGVGQRDAGADQNDRHAVGRRLDALSRRRLRQRGGGGEGEEKTGQAESERGYRVRIGRIGRR